jgi:thiol-disulfide isomerase/thioredoxin
MIAISRTLACLALALGLPMAGVARADAPDLAGKWMLVVQSYGDDEFVIIDVKKEGDSYSAKPISSQRFFDESAIEGIALKDQALEVTFKVGNSKYPFRGTLAAPNAATGTLFFRNQINPAKLIRTNAEKVADIPARVILSKLSTAQREPDFKARVGKLREIIAANPKNVTLYRVYEVLLQLAGKAALPADEVKKLIETWIADAQPYGPDWTNEIRIDAVGALVAQKEYAPLAFELAEAAEKSLGEQATPGRRAKVVELLVVAAEAAGKADVAKSSRERLEQILVAADEEYKKSLPPFHPEPFARPESGSARVALIEMFTGSECPPCVAADLAFDSLIESTKPTEVVALQYHLHIPGPDPMTNAASEERAKYYGVGSTPSPYFNGKAEEKVRGGGAGPGPGAEIWAVSGPPRRVDEGPAGGNDRPCRDGIGRRDRDQGECQGGNPQGWEAPAPARPG